MSNLAPYWTLMRLTLSGQIKAQEIPHARALVEALCAAEGEVPQDRALQKQLYLHEDQTTAQLCFRCYISHQIISGCNELVHKFGQYYGFSRQALLPYVLDDDGKSVERTHGPEPNPEPDLESNPSQHQPFSLSVLKKFDPNKASLKTWTRRLIDHSDELNHCLNQFGLWRITDWGLLNQAKPNPVRRILGEFHSLTSSEIERDVSLLESYRAVYVSDRLLNRQVGKRCHPPTEAQLQRMSDQIHQKYGWDWTPEEIDSRLLALATRLRQYGLYKRNQRLPTQSMEREALERQPAPAESESNQKQIEDFFSAYQTALSACLPQAMQQVIEHRLQNLKPAKRSSFIAALKLFHCAGTTMSKIAPQVGLKTQVQVSRLLRLKELRSDIRRQAIATLKAQVQTQAEQLVDPEQLVQVDQAIEAVLAEQIDAFLTEEAKNAQTSKDEPCKTYFSQSLCRVLSQF